MGYVVLTETQKENVQKLIENLRSGEYTQGQGKLRPKDDEYCCMGVAVATLGYEFYKVDDGRFVWAYRPESGYEEVFLMPHSDAAKFGLDKRITDEERAKLPGHAGANTRQDYLVWCNDKEGEGFLDIADEIERMGWDYK